VLALVQSAAERHAVTRRGEPPMSARDQLRSFIRDSFLVDGFADEDSFLGTGLIDSLGVLQLVSFIEAKYGLSVPDTDLVPANFDSVANLASYIERRSSGQAA
jgi:acyl carrier protein